MHFGIETVFKAAIEAAGRAGFALEKRTEVIHKDKDQFIDVINITVQRTGFRAPLFEKDYYLTLILSRVDELSEDLIFKGGTCLNKIYYSYYHLSEDLDFSMKLPRYEATRGALAHRERVIRRLISNGVNNGREK